VKSWRVPTSAILGIAFALALLAGWWISRDAINSQTTYEQHAKQYAEADREAAYRHAQASCVRLARAEARECVHKQYHAAREAERQEYDLEAQRVTSAWTRAMGLAAIVGMVFGILGVGLVWRTFEATREGNEIARSQMLAATRPILSFDGVIGHDKALDMWDPRFRWKNIGRGPAKIVSLDIGYHICKAGEVPDFDAIFANMRPKIRRGVGAVIPADQPHESEKLDGVHLAHVYEPGCEKLRTSFLLAKIGYVNAIAPDPQTVFTTKVAVKVIGLVQHVAPEIKGKARDALVPIAPITDKKLKLGKFRTVWLHKGYTTEPVDDIKAVQMT
jgi:hypothetical protein